MDCNSKFTWSGILIQRSGSLGMRLGQECSSAALLYLYSFTINTDMNGRVCGALVQFGCSQHRHEWMNMKASIYDWANLNYASCTCCSIPGKRPLPGKCPCTTFQGATVAASIQTYKILIPGKPGQNRELCLSAHGLTRDTTVYTLYMCTYTRTSIRACSCTCSAFRVQSCSWHMLTRLCLKSVLLLH